MHGFSTRSTICPVEPTSETSEYDTKPSKAPSVPSTLGAVVGVFGGTPYSYATTRFFTPTPIRGPTAWIEPPRRAALAIRAAEGEIAEGLQQNHAKVEHRPAIESKEDPTSSISGKK